MPTTSLPILYAIATLLFSWEHIRPAHPDKPDWRWYLRALGINALQLLVFYLVGSIWPRLGSHASLFSLQSYLSPLSGALLAYFIFTFIEYWWHRARHASPLIWRLFHQLHHSPQRIQTLTAYYMHPLDLLVSLLLSNFIVYVLLGLNFQAADWYTLITGLAGYFIHANIRVPRWLGYLYQTPEMHRLHHKRGHHAHNYGDIPLWDMLFGTYCNPSQPVAQCGFDAQHERRVLAMLLGKDLYQSN